MNYKNDKRSNEISGHDRWEYQYYEQMNMWNTQRVIMVNPMLANAQEDDNHHSMQTTQQNSLASATKNKKMLQDKI